MNASKNYPAPKPWNTSWDHEIFFTERSQEQSLSTFWSIPKRKGALVYLNGIQLWAGSQLQKRYQGITVGLNHMAVSSFNCSSSQSRWSLQLIYSNLNQDLWPTGTSYYVSQGGYTTNHKVRKRLSGTSVALIELLAEERRRQIIAFLALCDPVMLQCSQVPRVVLGLYTLRRKAPELIRQGLASSGSEQSEYLANGQMWLEIIHHSSYGAHACICAWHELQKSKPSTEVLTRQRRIDDDKDD